MKKAEIRKFSIFFISVVVLLAACIKNNTDAISYDGDFSVSSAQKWYEENKSQFDQITNLDIFKTSNYTPVWDKAQQAEDSLYEVIEVPLSFKKSIGINTHSSQNSADTVNKASLTKLLILRNKETKELIGSLMNILFDNGMIDYSIGYDNNTRKSFTGDIFYTKLNGDFVNGWVYKNGEIVKTSNASLNEDVSLSTKHQRTKRTVNFNNDSRQMIASQKQSIALSTERPPMYSYDRPIEEKDCYIREIHWYERLCWGSICTPWEYLYTDRIEYCYYLGGNGGGGYTNYTTKTVPPPAPDSIITDTGISNNPIVKCIYNALMDTSLENSLAKILTKFQGETGYNVTFKIGQTSNGDMGQTVQSDPTTFTSKNITITIRSAEAYDTNYSRVLLAKTFIHESFHAKLMQYALETFGTTELNSWPKSTNDATLAELIDYVQSSAERTGKWDSETHDWMVNHINELSNSLKFFVEKYYPANTQWDDVKNASDPLEPYRAVMFMGLQGTQLYLSTIANNTIRTSNFNGYIQSLTANAKSCPIIQLD